MMKNLKMVPLLAVFILSAYGNARAADSNSLKKKKKPVHVKVLQGKKKRTVGDILQSIDSSGRGKNVAIQKKALAIPEAQTTRMTTVPMTEVKPPKSSELFKETGTDEEKLEQITDEGINELYSLSQKYAKSNKRGQLWLRLAELYVEKAKYIEMRIQNDFDKKISVHLQKKGPKPVLNLSKAREYNLKAIKLYEWFLRDYPQDNRLDQALFFLGYNYIELDQLKKGVYYYEKLTKDFPQSPYIGEANFALGEYYFDNNKWREAYKAYREVLKNRRARLYTFALYKMAWCQFRLEKPADGIKTLEEVIRLSRNGAQNSDNVAGRKAVSRIRLGSEALKDIVLFYGEVGNYQTASEYFAQIGGETARYPMLEKLAYLYSDQGRKEQAQFLYKQLLEHDPVGPKAFDYQYQIVQNFSTSKNQSTYKQELYTWIDKYGPESEWAHDNIANKKLMDDAYTLRESALRNYTLLLHKNAQNSAKKPDMIQAKEAYHLYLSKFNDSPKAVEMHFFFGELLYGINEYADACKEYRYVVEKEPNGKYYELAVLNSLLSLEKSLKSDAQIKEMVGENLQPVPFGEAETAFVSAGEKYINGFPRGEKAVDVKFKVGRLNYSFNHFDEALRLFRQIIIQNPRTPYAVYSANLILDIHNIRKDYDNLSKEGLALMRNSDLTQQGFQTDVRDLVEKASFKKAQELETSKSYEASAKSFNDFSRNYPHSALAVSAAYNAGINYERGYKFAEAISMYQKVLGAPPKGNEQLKQKTTLLLSRLYEQSSQYEQAAALIEKYAKENPKDKVTPDLLYNAAVIWESQKEYNRAIGDYDKYYQISKKRDRHQVLYTIAKIHEKEGHFKITQEYYEKYVNSGDDDYEKIVESYFKIAELNGHRGNNTEAEKGYARTVGVQKNFAAKGKNVGLMWAAEAKFHLTEKIYAELVALRIPANPKRQGEVVKEKLGLLTKLNQNLADVIRYDEGNMVIASLATLGKAYDHMSSAIYGAPLPKDLNAQEMEAYKKGVDGVARPLQEKAIENYVAAINKSFEINYYNQWTKTALDVMAKKDPEKFAEPKESVISVIRTDDKGI